MAQTRFGAIFPQTEIGTDPVAIRDYAQAVEAMGYAHLAMYDHVIGADPSARPGWSGPYQLKDTFHEPFVLMGYLAAVTQRLELLPAVLILAQRQTALVAKQAAEVDVLSGGRFRLGVGIGWNDVEYEALGEDFKTRGKRVDEQIEVLRQLWGNEVLTYAGRFHKITAAGINPLPLRRNIPIWIGGGSEAALRRAARLGDGWFPQSSRGTKHAQELVGELHTQLRELGRDPSTFGVEARVTGGKGTADQWRQDCEAWRSVGATHIAVTTHAVGLTGVDQHIQALRAYADAARDMMASV